MSAHFLCYYCGGGFEDDDSGLALPYAPKEQAHPDCILNEHAASDCDGEEPIHETCILIDQAYEMTLEIAKERKQS